MEQYLINEYNVFEDENYLTNKNQIEEYFKAEIGSSRQDYGEDLYFIDYIDSVTYKQIDKPLPKEKQKVKYELLLTKEQKKLLEDYMEEIHIEF